MTAKKCLCTVLYEDRMQAGADGFSLHILVVRMVEDDINGETWRLRETLSANPCKGIGNVLNGIKRTELLAGSGRLFILVDKDKLASHLNLPKNADESKLVEALKAKSDAPDKLTPFFLHPNLEGVLKNLQECDFAFCTDAIRKAIERKKLNERDIVLKSAANQNMKDLRDCLRKKQPGLDGLVKAIAALIR